MCTAQRAILAVGRIKQHMQGSHPQGKGLQVSRCADLHTPALSSAPAPHQPFLTQMLQYLEESECRSQATQNCHSLTNSFSAISHLLLRHSLIAIFARVFLSSKNRQIWPKGQMHPTKHYTMAWGHSLISFKYLRTAEMQGPTENILPNPYEEMPIAALFQHCPRNQH